MSDPIHSNVVDSQRRPPDAYPATPEWAAVGRGQNGAFPTAGGGCPRLTGCPPPGVLSAVLAANGRMPGLCKHVLESSWWFIDESGPARKRVATTAPPVPTAPALALPCVDSLPRSSLLESACDIGWPVVDSPLGLCVALGGKRRASAGLFDVAGRGPSLCVGILAESEILTDAAAAYALRLSSFLRLVRASLLDFGHGQRLVWESPLDAAAPSAGQSFDALCCLANAVQLSQTEVVLLAHDEAAATCWLEMNFPPTQPY